MAITSAPPPPSSPSSPSPPQALAQTPSCLTPLATIMLPTLAHIISTPEQHSTTLLEGSLDLLGLLVQPAAPGVLGGGSPSASRTSVGSLGGDAGRSSATAAAGCSSAGQALDQVNPTCLYYLFYCSLCVR